jgi:hypothetical protein
MYTIGPRRKCDINPVVDQHPRPVRLCDRAGRARQLGQRTRAEISFADLNQLTAGGSGNGDRFQLRGPIIRCPRFRRMTAQRSPIGDQVEERPVSRQSRWRVVQFCHRTASPRRRRTARSRGICRSPRARPRC